MNATLWHIFMNYSSLISPSLPLAPQEGVNCFAFAVQKLDEVKRIADLSSGSPRLDRARVLAENKAAIESRRNSPRIHRPQVKARVEAVGARDLQRASAFPARRRKQQEALKLPLFPTSTIGSLPQTAEVRRLRAQLGQGKIGEAEYDGALQREIERAIRFQEEIGMDLLVHGEFERNDMVQYFGEQLEGCCFTQHGWVQSFGSRCVRPPVIFGDVERKGPMTLRWSGFARSL